MKKIPLASLAAFILLLPGLSAASDFTFMMPCTRANAVGSAFSTVTGDPCAVFYNPADLTTLSDMGVNVETARRLTPDAPEGESTLTYVRPVPDTQNKVAGFGYYAIRQKGGNALDSLTFSLGDRTVIKYLQKPLFYGGGFKLMSLRGDKSHLALGGEGGLQIENNLGLRTALVFSNVLLGAGRPLMTITLGNSFRIGDLTLLADLRARGSYSELFFGAERSLFNGLLEVRAGKGQSLGGGQYLAMGLGVNASPWQTDFTWSLPWAGYHELYGYYGFDVGYRFGAPPFSEKFVGDAARTASDLRTQIDDLRTQRAALDNDIATYRVNKGMLASDLTLMQGRMRDLEDKIKVLQAQAVEALYRKENPPVPKKVYIPPPPRWPRLHKVAPGETLRSIASKYYGDPNLWERVYQANEKHISRGLPVEGSVLTIPPPPADGE